ncbi:hypothetical protein [Actinoplanes sp. ATCC 53533]|jgi:hypothetical protein|nr:hypothetical protein [Actinoplanes sp. ATCC 53533]
MGPLDPTRRARAGLSRLFEPGAADVIADLGPAEGPDPARDDSGLER